MVREMHGMGMIELRFTQLTIGEVRMKRAFGGRKRAYCSAKSGNSDIRITVCGQRRGLWDWLSQIVTHFASPGENAKGDCSHGALKQRRIRLWEACHGVFNAL